MKKYQIGALLIATLAVGSFYAWSRLSAELQPSTESSVPDSGDSEPPTLKRHLATERMIVASDKAAGTTAPEFEARATDGKTYRLSEMVKDGPVVLVFIKDGCPCSKAADQFLKRLHTAGRGWVPFYGVIDGDLAVAEHWAEETQAAFPTLADPNLNIIHTYGAENSAYVAFIAPGGEIDKLWAGFSETMLKELGERMARWVKPGLAPFDVSDAPADLYAGCAYE